MRAPWCGHYCAGLREVRPLAGANVQVVGALDWVRARLGGTFPFPQSQRRKLQREGLLIRRVENLPSQAYPSVTGGTLGMAREGQLVKGGVGKGERN